MALTFIKTHQHAFVVDTAPDEFRKKLNMIFGRSVYLYAQLVITDSNPKGVMTYSDYCNPVPVQICDKKDIVEQREPNEIEIDIFNRISRNRKLIKANREYLKENFYSKIDSRQVKNSDKDNQE